ncbi:hypothetical protein GCM10009747_30520 [Agromyces humatus]|uniref:Uncharacterized protein n=1 Tax=Agromyces humatus TaxID=279573 RepID=A0ABN2KW00_9MICO
MPANQPHPTQPVTWVSLMWNNSLAFVRVRDAVRPRTVVLIVTVGTRPGPVIMQFA